MKIIAVTACPTGIAHSQMAAENLETAAEEMGHDVHVEIQGAMGAENELTDEDVAAADVVIIASDTTVHTDRFEGVPIVKGTVKDAVNDAEGMIREAEAEVEGAGGATGESTDATAAAEPADESAASTASDAAPRTDAGSASDAGATADAPATGDDAAAPAGGADDASADDTRNTSSAGAADERRERQGLVGKIKSLFS